MKRSNLILIALNLSLISAGLILFLQNSESLKATLTGNSIVAFGEYDVVGTADVDADGQITTADTLYVKSCVGDITDPSRAYCRGQWQRITSSNPSDGIVKYQKIGKADLNGDGRITLGDVLYVQSCQDRLAPDPCHGQLIRRRVISGRVVDASGNGIAGVSLTAVGVDGDGDPCP